MAGKEKACICMYEHVIEDDQAPAACDAHKTRFSQTLMKGKLPAISGESGPAEWNRAWMLTLK